DGQSDAGAPAAAAMNSSDSSWQPVEADAEAALRILGQPLEALADGAVPAIVMRGSYPAELCQRLHDRLLAEGLLYDPAGPVPEKFAEAGIPEGYYREGRQGTERRAWQENVASGRHRIDIGTSLGYRGSDPDAFFAHAAETHDLFARLPNPIDLIHDRLRILSRGKRVRTAQEPDGRRYGPAIIRAHYGGYTYRPHFDSVRLREKREGYAVYHFEHQFAGVLVLRNSVRAGRVAEGILHRYLWQPEVQFYLDAGTFAEFARERGLEQVQIQLDPGDLYFFNTRLIHEVPGVDGPEPRVVLATFIGYSAEREDIFVWS
ncbi:MAG TPA: hypothetical protein VFA18_14025, partial [Gemmataceae bacterium]|nr:hypothetical protein [Gemmataceae bacterium]